MQSIDNYTFEEEEQIIQSATRRKELKRHDQTIKEKHFHVRNKSIQQYFMRMSCGSKKKFILRLLESIGNLAGVVQILHVMSWTSAKMAVYTVSDPETNFVYDKLILDHNRMLDDKVLAETVDNDIAWFSTLEDYFQVTLIQDLLRISAGTVKRHLYLPIFRLYHQKLLAYRQSQREKTANVSQKSSVDEKLFEDEDEYDPKHPATIEVEKQRKRWAEMIAKYRAEVEGAVKNKTDIVEKDDKKTKRKEKSTGKTKSDGTSRKSDKKKEKSAELEEIDMLQLIPIWIVKKILCYLDQKTLLSLKRVNRYWSFVIQDLLKEIKAKEGLNKYMENMKVRIGPEKLESAVKSSSDRKSLKKCNKGLHGVYYEVGAIPRKLVPTQNKNLADTSLASEAVNEIENEFAVITGELVSFPRLIRDDIQLYRHHPCFLQDVNVVYDVEDDIQRQRSFLTYSLTSVISSLKIHVNEQDLSDW